MSQWGYTSRYIISNVFLAKKTVERLGSLSGAIVDVMKSLLRLCFLSNSVGGSVKSHVRASPTSGNFSFEIGFSFHLDVYVTVHKFCKDVFILLSLLASVGWRILSTSYLDQFPF